MVSQVSSAKEFEDTIKSFQGLVVVDFFATWCGPCKMIAPLLEKFSTQYTEVKFLKVDVDAVQELAQQYQVTSMPTLLFFKNGEVIEKVIGANPSAIKKAIETNK
ncbi:thioredoxin trx1 [Lodderomyces elongisporus]|uniref:Thioredoxin n=1 Tax=Lodderomyces elongisporus (strain ATCC 11503 / CBS 2605 / JCM 1781 / NBRC 1676 / NRRL YB-4239) TaxID=379508 RepID=A5E6L1_LODEL|nr:thioredoxin trx1 [Lodderomyces elongisporus]EDK47069.1 conserved hypothetical protein [Lodderomyces elongisporus NRRL YB-4239]WLF78607.1 thioredoxin trx1 [Lodderomyces elongisporus]